MLYNFHSIDEIELSAMKLRHRRWRINTPSQIDESARQLKLTGQVELPLLDRENRVVCGSAIVQAAIKLGGTRIRVLHVANMTPDELRLYAVNAHMLNDMGKYDAALLAEEIRELEKLLGEDTLAALAMEEGELTRLLRLAESLDEDP